MQLSINATHQKLNDNHQAIQPVSLTNNSKYEKPYAPQKHDPNAPPTETLKELLLFIILFP